MLTSVLAQELFHELVPLDVIAPTTIARSPGLAVPSEARLLGPTAPFGLFFRHGLAQHTSRGPFSQSLVASSGFVAEVNLHELSLQDWVVLRAVFWSGDGCR